jgi:hypothetical protein
MRNGVDKNVRAIPTLRPAPRYMLPHTENLRADRQAYTIQSIGC